MSEMKEVIIYTDGACSGNPGPGGWAAALYHGEHVKVLHGGEQETTNNRMELMAAIEALEALKAPCAVTLFTDSQYVKNGMEQWLKGWKKNGWKNAQKQPVKNVDLWQRLDAAAAKHHIEWQWVKGHSGDEKNDFVDALARENIPTIFRPKDRKEG